MKLLRNLLASTALLLTALRGYGAPNLPVARLQPFPMRAVQLLDGPAKTALETNKRYLLSLEPDRLLYDFRINANLPAPGKPLGGWEAPTVELRGHFVGHYLSALALMYATTGDSRFLTRSKLMVTELAKCQLALGGQYLSAFPTTFWDRLETMQRPPWAPYYTIHKIMAGLFDQYMYCGSGQALTMLQAMVAYFKARTDKLSDAQMQRLLNVEFGGMEEVLYNLYSVTHNPAHLALAQRFEKRRFFDPLALDQDDLTGIHANTHIPQILGAARGYELTGSPRDKEIVRYFWNRVVYDRTYSTGGSNNGEGWGPPDKLAHTLSGTNQECCTTYNMLKVTRDLLRWTADAQYGDYYERAFFNGILGTQQEPSGQLMYYVPLATGYRRVFGTPNDSFWCCYGTGVESFSKLGDSIYFHDADGVYVDMFVASKLNWSQKGFSLVQRTAFPLEQATHFDVECTHPARLTVHIRVPGWVQPGFGIMVNGRQIPTTTTPGHYMAITRTWRSGDRVDVRLPMALHTAPMPDDPNLVSVMQGPIVLAGVLQSTGGRLNQQDMAPGPRTASDIYFTGHANIPSGWLRPVPGQPLTYQTVGQTRSMKFEPFYQVTNQRYGIYWPVYAPNDPVLRAILAKRAADAQAAQVLKQRTVDSVQIGVAASESAHNLQSEMSSAGPLGERNWRHAADGWFSYDMGLAASGPTSLLCTYWGSDGGGRAFDILVDGTMLTTVTLTRSHPNEYFSVETPIPPALTAGKNKVTVKFQAHPGSIAGGVFGCVTLKSSGAGHA